jgi:hypothetical protein
MSLFFGNDKNKEINSIIRPLSLINDISKKRGRENQSG